MRKNFTNLYLVGVSVFVMASLVTASFLFWDEYFKNSLMGKEMALKRAVGQRFGREKKEETIVALSLEKGKRLETGEVEVLVLIDTKEEKTWGGDLVIGFEPEKVSIVDILVGDFFEDSLLLDDSVSSVKEEIGLSVGSLDPIAGKGVLGKLIVRPVAEAESAVFSFSKRSQIALKGQEESAMTEYTDLSLVFAEEGVDQSDEN